MSSYNRNISYAVLNALQEKGVDISNESAPIIDKVLDFFNVSEQKLYKHDCDCCTYLGMHGVKDLYFCDQNGLPTVIARYGNEGADYISGLSFADHNEFIGEAKKRAIYLGLLKE